MQHHEVSWLSILGTSLMWAIVAIGAYALTRRRIAGLLAVVLPALFPIVSGKVFAGAVLIGCAVLVFGTPFALVFLHVRRSAISRPAA